MTEYRDKTPLPPDNASHHYLDPITKQLATYLREKMFGKDVRESLARAVERFAELFGQTKAYSDKTRQLASDIEKRQEMLEERYDEQIAGRTELSEVIDARDSQHFSKKKSNLKETVRFC